MWVHGLLQIPKRIEYVGAWTTTISKRIEYVGTWTTTIPNV